MTICGRKSAGRSFGWRTCRRKWRVRIALEGSRNTDPENIIGVASGASDGFDRTDSRKPPLFGDQAYLYFDRPEWDKTYHRFNGDVRGSLGDGQSWPFTVSAHAGEKAVIHFDGLGELPAGYRAVLVSPWNSTPVDVRANGAYAFTCVAPLTATISAPAGARTRAPVLLSATVVDPNTPSSANACAAAAAVEKKCADDCGI